MSPHRSEASSNDKSVELGPIVWSRFEVDGEKPSARSSHTCTLVADTLVVFGGFGDGPLRDFYHIQKDTFKSSFIAPQTTQDTHARLGHSAVSFSKHIYFFGGWNGSEYLNSGLLYDVDTMKLVVERSKGRSVPPARRDHSCVIVNNQMFVIGGWNCVEQFNDTWILDDSWSWEKAVVSGSLPIARRGHSASAIGRYVFVFGGIYGYSKYLSDFYVLDTKDLCWHQLPLKGDHPSARAWHSATVVGKFIIVFGGTAGRTHFYNDIYALNIETLQWRQLQLEGDMVEERCSHSAALVDDEIVVFGGITPSSLENTIYPLDGFARFGVDRALKQSKEFDSSNFVIDFETLNFDDE